MKAADHLKPVVYIVGGGASGLVAAIMAAREGAAVTVLEQNEKPGKKICATGNGKCNLTNLEMRSDSYRGTHPEFAETPLSLFTVQDTIDFFAKIGILTVNRNGYLYPRSGQASSVTEVLSMEAKSLGVKLRTNTKVTNIYKQKELWKVEVEGWTYEADRVILANGSRASAISGSDGSGYQIARSLGHRIIQPLPALTALKCKAKTGSFSTWSGVRTEGEAALFINDTLVKKEKGELQLTEYGISGIPIFQLSRYAIRALQENSIVSLKVDFFPELSAKELHCLLEERRESCPYKNRNELLIGLFPEKLIKVLCKEKDLERAVKEYPLQVTDGMSFAQAQVCSGGVDTAEINPATLESRLHKGLYITGELLDIDGTCGGYNLQWAWSTGAVAGREAGQQAMPETTYKQMQ